jgi:hypothetical protein
MLLLRERWVGRGMIGEDGVVGLLKCGSSSNYVLSQIKYTESKLPFGIPSVSLHDIAQLIPIPL